MRRTPVTDEDGWLLDEAMAAAGPEVEALMRDEWRSEDDWCFAMHVFPEFSLTGWIRIVCSTCDAVAEGRPVLCSECNFQLCRCERTVSCPA